MILLKRTESIRKQPCYPKRDFGAKYELNVTGGEVSPRRINFGDKHYQTYPIGKANCFGKKKTSFSVAYTLLTCLGENPEAFILNRCRGENRYDIKAMMRYTYELVGSKATQRANAAAWSENVFCWPEEVIKLLRPVRENPLGKVDSSRIYLAFKHQDILTELYHDGLVHLAPVTAYLGTTPQQMKQLLGKGLWKRLLSQSPTRINLIGENLRYISGDLLPVAVENLLGIRSGILRSGDLVQHAPSVAAARLAPTIKDFQHTRNLIIDLQYMRRSRGLTMNYDWSLSRMKEEHELEVQIKREKDRKLREARDAQASASFAEPLVETIDGYTFTRLCTKTSIADEGWEMHHCVGSYADRAFLRVYDVFTVEGKEERATLGMNLVDTTLVDGTGASKWASFNQCYRKYNERVSDELHQACGKLILKLNVGKAPKTF